MIKPPDICPYCKIKKGTIIKKNKHVAYALRNMSVHIGKCKKRLERIKQLKAKLSCGIDGD